MWRHLRSISYEENRLFETVHPAPSFLRDFNAIVTSGSCNLHTQSFSAPARVSETNPSNTRPVGTPQATYPLRQHHFAKDPQTPRVNCVSCRHPMSALAIKKKKQPRNPPIAVTLPRQAKAMAAPRQHLIPHQDSHEVEEASRSQDKETTMEEARRSQD